MREKDVQLKHVAAAAGMSASQLSRVLNSLKVFTVDQLDAVCDALGLSMPHVIATADVETRTRRGVPELVDGPESATPDNIVRGRFGADVGGSVEDDLDAVARTTDPEPTDEQ